MAPALLALIPSKAIRGSRVVEQSVEDTPRESTVSAATLQSQIDDLLLYR
jgi:hypothetical protein